MGRISLGPHTLMFTKIEFLRFSSIYLNAYVEKGYIHGELSCELLNWIKLARNWVQPLAHLITVIPIEILNRVIAINCSRKTLSN
jgi:hypothetical protein